MTSNGNPSSSLDPSSIASRHGGGSTSSTPASTIRPRNRRLISFVDDSSGDDGENGRTRNSPEHPATSSRLSVAQSSRLRTSPSPSSSRDVSPMPSRHPSRATSSSSYRKDSSPKRSRADREGDNRGKSPMSGFATDFWDSSWSSLQGLASTVMGTETSRGTNSGFSWINGQPSGKASGPGSFRVGASGGSRPSLPSSWGPSNIAEEQATPGSKEERDALVQAKKREALLLANGDTMADSLGNYKRRGSGDATRSSTMQMSENLGSDPLVYVHQVQPNDSLTGVSIRYGCQPGVVRKANGFWPSDTIHVRRTVVIPVDACTIKGRPIRYNETGHHGVGDLLDDTDVDTSSLTPADQQPPTTTPAVGEYFPKLEHGSTTSSVSGMQPNKAPTWKHECWVQVDGFSEPLELGRVPRGTMGYFPRGRRKSQSKLRPYSDNDDTISATSSVAPFTPPRMSASPDRQQKFPSLSPSRSSPGPSSFRDRSTSNNMPSRPGNRHRRQRSSIVLHGIGGVGTLDRGTSEPGPGPDSLNTFVTSHLPHLAVPPPPPPPPPSSQAHGRRPGRLSVDSSSSIASASSTGMENVGGAIEGWFRKVATRAKSGLNELQQQQPSQLENDLGIRGNGDLIELGDTRESTRTATPSPSPDVSRRRAGSTLRTESTTSGISDSPSNRARGRRENRSEPSRTKDD